MRRDSARRPTLIHRDYHAWNTLWLGGRLTGIVDWTSTSWGPPAADLAHLRVDLVADVSVEAAVLAREAFAAAGGDLTNARHHQLRTVFDYFTSTDPDLFDDRVVERLDAFLELVLAEPDAPDVVRDGRRRGAVAGSSRGLTADQPGDHGRDPLDPQRVLGARRVEPVIGDERSVVGCAERQVVDVDEGDPASGRLVAEDRVVRRIAAACVAGSP